MWARAENYGRFNHPLKLKAEHWKGDNFNLCDDATSGFMQGWCADLQERFDRVERGELPGSSPSDLARADAELNSLYSKIQATRPVEPAIGTVTPQGIEIAERAWLHYREAWVKFGQAKYPAVAPDSWRAWLTRERVAMLRNPR